MPRFALFFAGMLFIAPALAQKADVYADRGGAIRGYDPVGYFTAGRPVKGSSQFSHQWRGATWHFASAENRDRFAAAPEKFAPQYGGYCAYGVAQGYAVSIDPAAWTIVDGKLYLNYSLSVRENWNKDIPGYIRKADANWPGVLKR
jgi:YHS domain-containing protein